MKITILFIQVYVVKVSTKLSRSRVGDGWWTADPRGGMPGYDFARCSEKNLHEIHKFLSNVERGGALGGGASANEKETLVSLSSSQVLQDLKPNEMKLLFHKPLVFLFMKTDKLWTHPVYF